MHQKLFQSWISSSIKITTTILYDDTISNIVEFPFPSKVKTKFKMINDCWKLEHSKLNFPYKVSCVFVDGGGIYVKRRKIVTYYRENHRKSLSLQDRRSFRPKIFLHHKSDIWSGNIIHNESFYKTIYDTASPRWQN